MFGSKLARANQGVGKIQIKINPLLWRGTCKICSHTTAPDNQNSPCPPPPVSLPRPAPFPSPSPLLALVNLEPNVSRIYTPQLKSWVSPLRTTVMKMERIESSETSALKAQTPGDHPKDTVRHSTHGESLESRLT